MNNKLLLSSLLTLLVSIFLVVAVTFAWFAIAKSAEAGLVGVVGDLNAKYSFAAIDKNEVIEGEGEGTLSMNDVMPGSKFIFVIVIENEGNAAGHISVNLNNITSYIATVNEKDENVYDLDEDYSTLGHQNKIQYAFGYKIYAAYWVPSGTSIDDLDKTDPLSVVKDTWIPFSDADKATYPTYDYDSNEDSLVDLKLFNSEKDSTSGGKIDQADYPLISNISVNSKDAVGLSADVTRNAFVLFFEIDFLNTPILPNFVKGENFNEQTFLDNFDGNIYGSQLFCINNVTIVAQKDD